jgi:selenide,water dikinase
MNTHAPIRLTQISPGAGCGCKISQRDLDAILSGVEPVHDARLVVGNDSRDDAAVYDLGNGLGLVSTTDFFTPIVDDPYDFGRIAATNAISDVYAMGGTPLLAIAILGWPLEKLPGAVAQVVLSGARAVCGEAGIALGGGHSIDIADPVFGLAVNGTVPLDRLKRNSTARPGDLLFLTKPLGIGAIATAQKRGVVTDAHHRAAVNWMTRLNKPGPAFAALDGVSAMTDVTGFGLLGHLVEMCAGSAVTATLWLDTLPVLDGAQGYIDSGCVPGGTGRNRASYGERIRGLDDGNYGLLCDPQTSGGLLVAVVPAAVGAFLDCAAEYGLELQPIGELGDAEPDHAVQLRARRSWAPLP